MPRIRGYVFDAYGTLFDVHSVIEAGREITSDPATLSATWRGKQLEYTWLRSLMGRYEDFWSVTAAALRYTIRCLALTATEAQGYALGPNAMGIAAEGLLFLSRRGPSRPPPTGSPPPSYFLPFPASFFFFT